MKATSSAPTPTAVELANDVKLTDAARQLLPASKSADDYIALLQSKGLPADAVRMLSVRLPRRHALWWGCLCLWERYRPEPDAAVEGALQAVVNWLKFPTEEMRRAAESKAEEIGLDTPAGLLAYAAFVSEGSLAPPTTPVAPVHPKLLPLHVANALLLASRTVAPDGAEACQQRFVSLGFDVNRTGAGCPEAAPR